MEGWVNGLHSLHEKFLLGSNSVEVVSDEVTGTQEISNCLMGAFEDTIGLRVLDSGQFGLNSIWFKQFLKFVRDKFCSIVMQTINRAGVLTEPNLVKGARDGDAFFVFQCCNFYEMHV